MQVEGCGGSETDRDYIKTRFLRENGFFLSTHLLHTRFILVRYHMSR